MFHILCVLLLILSFPLTGCQESSPPLPSGLVTDHEQWLEAALRLRGEFSSASHRIEDARHLVGLGRSLQSRNTLLHEEEGDSTGPGKITGRVSPGDTMAEVLEEAGGGAVQKYVNAAAQVFSLRSFRAGQPYVVFTDSAGHLTRFEYEVNDHRRLVVEGVELPRARMEDIEYQTVLALCEGVVDDSLFQAVADIGENPQLALKLVDLFNSEINFLRHVREGDRFAILVEKRFRDGEYKGYGRILGARFVNRGKIYEAWLFRDGQGQYNYYNSRGENLKKTLLMSPLAFTRLTSRFTHARRHPILGGARPHLGVDYAAPIGTPVKAVGSGVVTKRGWAGGYGNQIIVQHPGGLESMYAHLSGYARGLREGQPVRQGQVIGFVGNTGLSTGPHLDFRLRQNGNFINPTKAINPRGEPVPPHLMGQFQKAVSLERQYLNGAPLPEQYALDSIVPSRLSSEPAVAVGKEKSRNFGPSRKNPRLAKQRQMLKGRNMAKDSRSRPMARKTAHIKHKPKLADRHKSDAKSHAMRKGGPKQKRSSHNRG